MRLPGWAGTLTSLSKVEFMFFSSVCVHSYNVHILSDVQGTAKLQLVQPDHVSLNPRPTTFYVSLGSILNLSLSPFPCLYDINTEPTYRAREA